MFDPGGVVGVISLALQVFQGLSRYYASLRSFDDSIEQILNRIERLTGILRALEGPIRKLKIDDDAISEQVRLAITSCEHGLEKLRTTLKKCNDVPLPTTDQSRLQIFKNKALFPFRRGTLQDTGKCLDIFHSNLDTILQTLQLDTLIRFDEQADNRASLLSDQVTNIQNEQIYQTKLLKSIEGISQSHTELASAHASQTHNSIDDLSLQMRTLQEQMFNQFNVIAHSLQTQRLPAPSAVTEAMKARQDLSPYIQRLRIRNRECTCRADANPYFGHSYGLYWSRSNKHQPHCPRYNATERLDRFGAYLTIFGKAMNSIVHVSLGYGRGAGGLSISSTLTTRNYITDKHPAHRFFQVFNGLNLVKAAGDKSKVLDYIKCQMDDMFRNGSASPLDTSLGGGTWLDSACCLINEREIHSTHTVESMRNFLQFLITAGVPLDKPQEQDPLGYSSSPTSYILQCEWTDFGDEQEYLISYLFDVGAEWIIQNQYQGFSHKPSRLVPWLRHLLSKEAAREAYCGDPTELAILDQSAATLMDEVAAQEIPQIGGLRLEELLTLSADWPDGLRLLLKRYGASRIWRDTSHGPLGIALMTRNQESVDILLNAGFEISKKMWSFALWNWDINVIQDIIHRISGISPKFSFSSLDLERLFHERPLSEDVASRLYQSGFQNIDVELDDKPRIHWRIEKPALHLYPGTPLWMQSNMFISESEPEDFLRQFKTIYWLVDKGARMNYLQPVVGTTPAHLISASVTAYFFIHKKRVAGDLLKQEQIHELCIKAFTSQCPDRCNCACSKTGHCYPIASAIKFQAWAQLFKMGLLINGEDKATVQDIHSIWPTVLRSIIQLMEPVIFEYSHLFLVVLRVLTFERLGIKHTCHDEAFSRRFQSSYLWTYPLPPFQIPEEEIAELQDEYRDPINQLEELMLEFEGKWAIHKGTFQEFLDGYWSERMERVLDEIEPLTKEEIKAIEDIGVIIQKPFGPELPPGYSRTVTEVDGNESG